MESLKISSSWFIPENSFRLVPKGKGIWTLGYCASTVLIVKIFICLDQRELSSDANECCRHSAMTSKIVGKIYVFGEIPQFSSCYNSVGEESLCSDRYKVSTLSQMTNNSHLYICVISILWRNLLMKAFFSCYGIESKELKRGFFLLLSNKGRWTI